jgi:hypothetical protein
MKPKCPIRTADLHFWVHFCNNIYDHICLKSIFKGVDPGHIYIWQTGLKNLTLKYISVLKCPLLSNHGKLAHLSSHGILHESESWYFDLNHWIKMDGSNLMGLNFRESFLNKSGPFIFSSTVQGFRFLFEISFRNM